MTEGSQGGVEEGLKITPDYVQNMRLQEKNGSKPQVLRTSDVFPDLPVSIDSLIVTIQREIVPGEDGKDKSKLRMWAMEGMGRSVILPGVFEFQS